MRNLILVSLLFCTIACNNKNANKPLVIKNGELVIAYEQHGAGDTTLLFVHGWCIDKSYWDAQVKAFSPSYKVVTMDLGGHGKSGLNRSSWTVDDFASDVNAVIDSLQLKNIILIGHSMGGDIIMAAAIKNPKPVVGFIGIDNFKDFTDSFSVDDSKSINEYIQSFRTDYIKAAEVSVARDLFPPGSTDTASINRVITSVKQTDTAVSIQAIESIIDYALKETKLLPLVNVPVHLIVSDYTPTNESKLGIYAKQGYSVTVINGVGHYPMIEKPADFNNALQMVIYRIGSKE